VRRLAWGLLLAFAFAIPWEYSLDIGEPLGNIARIAGLVSLLAAVPAVLLAGRVRTPGPMQWLALVFFVWFCCTCLWSIQPHETLARLRGYVQVIMPVWLVWEFAENTEDLLQLLRAYVAGSWVLAVLTIASLASPVSVGQVRFVAIGQDPNDVARFLDLGLPMSALLLVQESGWRRKLAAFAYVPVGFAGVLLTASRAGFLAALVALGGCLLLLARRHRRRLFAVALSLPVIVAAFWFVVPRETLARITTIPGQLQHGDLNQRLKIWQAGWQAFARAPFFGSGAGTFVDAARMAPIDTAHNTALAVAVEGGVIALILAAAIVVGCAQAVLETKGPVRIALATALLVWVLTSMVAAVEQSRTTWFLMAVIALAARLAAEQPQAAEPCLPMAVGESA
jgi:O-antigen ligase